MLRKKNGSLREQNNKTLANEPFLSKNLSWNILIYHYHHKLLTTCVIMFTTLLHVYIMYITIWVLDSLNIFTKSLLQ